MGRDALMLNMYEYVDSFMHVPCGYDDLAARFCSKFWSKRRTRIAKMQFSMLTRMVESVSLEASQRNKEVEKKQKKTPKLTGPK